MPPLLWRVPVYAAGCLAPARGRAEWRRKWDSNLRNWRVLVERGELPASGGVDLIRRAFADALHERFGVLRPYRLLRGPVFLIAMCTAALLLIALISRGFATSRALLALARDYSLHPNTGVRYDVRGDRLFEYMAPIVIAAAVGGALLFVQRRALQSLGWRSWALLSFKVITMFTAASLLWVEGGQRRALGRWRAEASASAWRDWGWLLRSCWVLASPSCGALPTSAAAARSACTAW